ncbi:MAG: ATP-binding protein [Syntrophobacterales bacterium]|nr:ATP-binding protein [Syntrophobacterales bacterium]
MNDKNLLALYGLKYNPFVQNLPIEAIWVTPETENFTHRVQAMIPQGGFALITGDPGQGKSKTLQWISHALSAMPDITVGVMPEGRGFCELREGRSNYSLALPMINAPTGFGEI